MRTALLTLAAFCLVLFPSPIRGDNLLELMKAAKLTTALEAVNFAGLDEVLNGEGPFTLFLPTNEAFEKLPNDVATDKEKLREVLLYHVVPGLAPSSAVSNDLGLKTVGGKTIRMNIYLRSDFYPGIVTANGKKVVAADVKADNGIIHIIEDALYPLPQPSFIEILSNDPIKFGKALAAFGSSSFLGVLMSDPGPWTIFVPSEEAFGTLSDDDLRDFLSNTPQLDKTLMRHAVRGSIFRRGFTWSTLGTESEDELQAQVFKDDIYMISSKNNKARVVESDIVGENVVIHIIDSILE